MIQIKKPTLKAIFLFTLILSVLLVNVVYAEESVSNVTEISSDVFVGEVSAEEETYDFNSIQFLIDNASAGDTIFLKDKVYSGNGSAININKDITICGYESSKTVLNADNKSNIFVVSQNVHVTLINLTLTNGYTDSNGAAIENKGILTIYDSIISKNNAGGGAVYSMRNAELTVYNTLFDGNTATEGAAIDNYYGNLKVINSTFTNNIANEGGCVYNVFADFIVQNSTFTNNSATRGGGVYNNRGFMKIYNSRFYQNYAIHLGGGIKSWGKCVVRDSIIANNTGYNGGGLFISEYRMTVSNCLVEDNFAFDGAGFYADVGAQLNIKTTRIINNIAEADGGGINMYQGYLTLEDSVLINNTAPNLGGGIYYSDYPYSSEIKNIVLEDNSAEYGGGIYVGTLSVKMTNITLNGNSAKKGGGAIYNAGKITLNQAYLNSNNANDGGAIYSKDILNITDSFASNNNAKASGGVIYSLSALNINNSNFTSNVAIADGGVIYSNDVCDVKDSTFNSNVANHGAAIYAYSNLNVDNSRFSYNEIKHSYGTLFLINGHVNITNSLFAFNRGSDEGGSIFSYADVYINNTKFLSNAAKSYGAAIDNNGQMKVENSVFEKNKAYSAGAIDNAGDLLIIKSNFTDNKATNDGGSIYNKGNLNIIGSIFENNVASRNGGAIVAQRGVNVTHSVFYRNFDANCRAIFNDTWDELSISNNWWGVNNPDFEKLLNFNISDEFNWIVMSFNNVTPLIQDKNVNVTVGFDEITDKNNSVSKLDSLYLLPIFEVRLSNGNTFLVENGRALKSIHVPTADTIAAQMNNQSISLNVSINLDNIKRIINNKNVAVDYNGKATFKVRVIGDDLKPVGADEIIVIKIAGKSYNVKTDKNGWASKTFSLLPGKYSIITKYKNYSAKNTITVKKVLRAGNAIRKQSKIVKYSAILKSSNGKPIVGKIVKFTIKGKAYSAKTNKYGIATANFKNINVGCYFVYVKYVNSKVKATLNVRK